jgi:hypothetical protein
VTVRDSVEAEPENERYNVLKTNILYPINLSIERILTQHISVVVGGFYFPAISYGTPNAKTGYISLKKPSMGYSFEGRYYTSETKAAMNGLYLGGYFSARRSDIYVHAITATSEIEVTAHTGLFMFGAMIGAQRIRTKGFTTDISLGLGYYNVPGVPLIKDASEEPFKSLGGLTKYRSGLGPRFTWSLGYNF